MAIKSRLAKFANVTLTHLVLDSPFKDNIEIGKLGLDCSDDLVVARYTHDKTKKFDGVHMFGFFGKRAYTRSLLRILNSKVEYTDISPISY